MKSILGTLVLLSIHFSYSQSGESFPQMETESLEEREILIPAEIRGKYTIIGLAYSKKSEDALSSWFSPAYNQFMREPDKNNLFATDYDINLFFIPMVTGHKTAVYKSVMHKLQETIGPELYPHVLFYKGSLKEYKKMLALKKDEPHFFLLDDKGNIVWRTSGYYSTQKMQELVDHLDEALGEW